MINAKGRGPLSTIIDKTQSKRDVSEGREVLGGPRRGAAQELAPNQLFYDAMRNA